MADGLSVIRSYLQALGLTLVWKAYPVGTNFATIEQTSVVIEHHVSGHMPKLYVNDAPSN
jgi:hypothetical protein